MFLSALMVASCATMPVWAESVVQNTTEDQSPPEDFEITETVEEDIIVPEVDMDNDEMLDGFLETIIYEGVEGGSVSFPLTYAADNVAKNHLGETALKMYQALKDHCTKVANGEETSSKFVVDMEAYGFKSVFTAEDLGVSTIISGGVITDEAKTSFRQKFADEINFNGAFKCLLDDNPYIMYWFDKTIGSTFRYGYGTVRNSDGTYSLKASNLQVTLYVAPGYNADDTYLTVDPTAVNAAKEASANAHQIVFAHENEGDYEKICSYKNEIIDLVAYNDDAAYATDFESYGTSDPWQLIWVFDGDPETKVVCEGYSKAMQYLCELSAFKSPYVECYSVTGTLGDGGHMWNIVVMDDNIPYLVDVTNMDTGTIGGTLGGAFLNGAVSGDVENGFVMPNFGEALKFVYDSTTLVTISHDVLNISKTDYDPMAVSPTVETNHVSFDWNFGTSGFVDDITLTAGETSTIPECTYTKENHTFKNWNTAIDGTGTSYEAGATVDGLITTDTENVILYAQWEENTKYSISFDWNYGTSGAVDGMVVYEGTSIELPENGFTKDHATFTGWNTELDGSGTDYQPGDTVDSVTGDMTFYAQWQNVDEYDIRFDWNYANSGSVDNIKAYADSSFELPENGFTKDHATFTGWNTEADGSGTAYQPGDTVDSVTGDMTFYAQWEAAKRATISFDWNYAESGEMGDLTVYSDSKVTMPENNFNKEGYTFLGWNTEMDGSGIIIEDQAEVDLYKLAEEKDIILYAQWAEISNP